MSEITAEDVARVASSFAKQELEVGARLERERIIKLLEAEMKYLTEAVCDGQVDVVPGVERYRRIIETITAIGENK